MIACCNLRIHSRKSAFLAALDFIHTILRAYDAVFGVRERRRHKPAHNAVLEGAIMLRSSSLY